MMLSDPRLRVDAVTRFEQEKKAQREAVRFAVALLFGSLLFVALLFAYELR